MLDTFGGGSKLGYFDYRPANLSNIFKCNRHSLALKGDVDPGEVMSSYSRWESVTRHLNRRELTQAMKPQDIQKFVLFNLAEDLMTREIVYMYPELRRKH